MGRTLMRPACRPRGKRAATWCCRGARLSRSCRAPCRRGLLRYNDPVFLGAILLTAGSMTTATGTTDAKRMYIDGKCCDADSGRTLKVINPATEEVITEIAYGGRAEVKRALEAAQRAMQTW